MFEIFPNWLNDVEVRRPRWPLPEPSLLSSVTKERSTWPCVLDHCHFGMSECIPCAASCLMSSNFPPVFSENTLHSPCHQFWLIACVAHISPKHQWSTSVFHSRHGVLSLYVLLTPPECSVYGCGQKRHNFGLITPNNCSRGFEGFLCAVWYVNNGLLCAIGIVAAFVISVGGFIYASQTIFLAVLYQVCIGLTNRGLVSTESFIFYFLIRVWILLIGISRFLEIFLGPFTVE